MDVLLRLLTFVVHAASSSRSWNPAAFVYRRLPRTRRLIKEARIHAADVEIAVELTEVLQSHPVRIRNMFESHNGELESHLALGLNAYQNSPSSSTEWHFSRSWGLTVCHKGDLWDRVTLENFTKAAAKLWRHSSHRSLQSPIHSPVRQGFHKRTRFTGFPWLTN